MAKSINGIGVMSGKVGPNVYIPNKGDKKYPQIIRGYQPNVYNPKSSAQTLQRSKMNVAGQISSVASSDLLTSFGGRKRANRSAFVSHLLKVAEEWQGKMGVYCPDIIFSKSRVTPFEVNYSLQASVAQGVSGTVTINGASVGDGVRVVALVFFKTPSAYGYDSITYADYVKSTDSNTLTISQPISVSNIAAQTNVSIYVYVIPFTVDEATRSIIYGQANAELGTSGNGDHIVAAVTESLRAGTGVNWGKTICTDEEGYQLRSAPVSDGSLTIDAQPNGCCDIMVNGEPYTAGTKLTFADGAHVTVETEAKEGFTFESWSDGAREASRTITITGGADTTLTVQYSQD